MTTTEVPDLKSVTKRAEVELEDACNNGDHMPAYLAALKLFGIPALEQCGPEELEHIRLLITEARRQAEWTVRDLDSLAGNLDVLLVAAHAGSTW